MDREQYVNGVSFALAASRTYGIQSALREIRVQRDQPARASYVAGLCDATLSLVCADRRRGVTRS